MLCQIDFLLAWLCLLLLCEEDLWTLLQRQISLLQHQENCNIHRPVSGISTLEWQRETAHKEVQHPDQSKGFNEALRGTQPKALRLCTVWAKVHHHFHQCHGERTGLECLKFLSLLLLLAALTPHPNRSFSLEDCRWVGKIWHGFPFCWVYFRSSEWEIQIWSFSCGKIHGERARWCLQKLKDQQQRQQQPQQQPPQQQQRCYTMVYGAECTNHYDNCQHLTFW